MTLEEIARQLVANCRSGLERQGLSDLYHPDCESIEAEDPPGGSRISRGVMAIEGKHDWWAKHFDLHESEVEGPFLHGPNRFAVIFMMDVTEKATHKRWRGKEVGLYTISDGKIVKEEFFQPLM